MSERTPVEDRIRALFRDEFSNEAATWESSGGLPRSVFERLGAIGAFEARWPANGEANGDVSVGAALARESALVSMGAGICIGAHTDGLIPALRHSGLAVEAGEGVNDGSVIGCVAISEATSGSDVARCATEAERTDDGWRITGHKHYVSNFRTATDCVVFTRTSSADNPSDFTLFLVPTDSPAIDAVPHDLMGVKASGTHMVDFNGVEIGDERRVGEAGSGLQLIMDFLRLERIWAAVGAAAVAELCLDIALAFAARRRVGEALLREQQAIGHRLADMASGVAAAQLVAANAVEAAGEKRLTAAASARAKLFTAQIAWQVADETMQILGGRGYTGETPMSQLWRDIRIARIGGGTDEVLRELIARAQRRGSLSDHPTVRAVAEAADAQPD